MYLYTRFLSSYADTDTTNVTLWNAYLPYVSPCGTYHTYVFFNTVQTMTPTQERFRLRKSVYFQFRHSFNAVKIWCQILKSSCSSLMLHNIQQILLRSSRYTCINSQKPGIESLPAEEYIYVTLPAQQYRIHTYTYIYLLLFC